MVTIRNSDTKQVLRSATGIQGATEVIPENLNPSVQATVEINPELLRRCNYAATAVAINATSATLATLDSGNIDFYLCGGEMSFIKDATSDSTKSFISCTPEATNTATEIVRAAQLTLTAQSGAIPFTINPPLKLKRGSTITCGNSTNTGNSTTQASIWGFKVYNPTT